MKPFKIFHRESGLELRKYAEHEGDVIPGLASGYHQLRWRANYDCLNYMVDQTGSPAFLYFEPLDGWSFEVLDPSVWEIRFDSWLAKSNPAARRLVRFGRCGILATRRTAMRLIRMLRF